MPKFTFLILIYQWDAHGGYSPGCYALLKKIQAELFARRKREKDQGDTLPLAPAEVPSLPARTVAEVRLPRSTTRANAAVI